MGAAVLVFCSLLLASPVAIQWRYNFAGVRSQGVVERRSEAQIESEVKRFLGPPTVRLGRYVIYQSESDKWRAAGQGGADCDYDRWRATIDRRGLSHEPIPCPEMVEALKLGANLALRSVDSGCRVRSVLLQGDSDPFNIRIGTWQSEIVSVDIHPSASPSVPNVEFVLTTRLAINASVARESLEYLLRIARLRYAGVLLRNDPWFAQACSSPLLFFFGDAGPIRLPTKAEYLSGSQVSCGNLGGTVSCLTWPKQTPAATGKGGR
jgi:hypothetical protein